MNKIKYLFKRKNKLLKKLGISEKLFLEKPYEFIRIASEKTDVRYMARFSLEYLGTVHTVDLQTIDDWVEINFIIEDKKVSKIYEKYITSLIKLYDPQTKTRD